MNTTIPVRSTPLSSTFTPVQGSSGLPATYWSPLERLAALRQDMDRLWEVTFPGRASGADEGFPVMDLYDESERLVAKFDLPGLSKEQIAINYQDGVLTISGERKSDYPEGQEPDSYRCERMTGKFLRNVALPVPVQADKVGATYKDGTLTVLLPKSEDARPHKVEVTVA